MKTKGDARSFYLNIIDEATKKGVAVAESKNADYNHKFDYFLDESQKYVSNIVKIPEVFQVTQNPIPNIKGSGNGFELIQVLPGEPEIFEVTGCKSTYFEMDNIGTCTISINGVVNQTINNTVQGTFTAYKVLIPATETDVVKLEFSGLYPYNIRNVGLFAYTFPTSTDIPEYVPYTTTDMPSDFLEFDSVIIKADPMIYEAYVMHKWENNKKVIFNYHDSGSFDIHYYKYPADILPDAADTTPLEIEDKAFDLVAMQCAVLATAADNPALSSWVRSLYIEKVQNTLQIKKHMFNAIQTIFAAE